MALFLADDAGSHVVAETLARMQLLLAKGDTDPFLEKVALSAIGVFQRADLGPLPRSTQNDLAKLRSDTRIN